VSAVAPPRSQQWADPDVQAIETLIADSETRGWRDALGSRAGAYPFFARRMRDLALGNWHLLFARSRDSAALDIGCGFGSLVLGLSEYYRRVVGLDALTTRIRYARLRAGQDGRANAAFVEGTGFHLPFARDEFQLVTMNGVLEWAGLHEQGEPADLQRGLLAEARRVVAPTGVLAVAIENRFAMETLAGMRDTHTGLRLVPALPRGVANAVTRTMKRHDYRTYLYDAPGYVRLVRAGGFAEARVLDLISSYNDYDFVLQLGDTASYRLLWRRRAVRTFFSRAGAARRALALLRPSALGAFGYAYLVVGGADARTVLDDTHPFWAIAARHGVRPGHARFACKGTAVGSMAIVTHDERQIETVLELCVNGSATGDLTASLSDHIIGALGLDNAVQPVAAWHAGDIGVRAYRMAAASRMPPRAATAGPRTPWGGADGPATVAETREH
jgi:SAM-dependent methyltransferase